MEGNFVKYHDNTRKSSDANQKEVPLFQVQNSEQCLILGYHRFYLDNKGTVLNHPGNPYALKEDIIGDILVRLHLKYNVTTILDTGCYTGKHSFMARSAGFDNINGIDHDHEAVDVFVKAIEFSKQQDTIFTKVSSVKEYITKTTKKFQVVLCLALIHWLYSCTEDFGSLKNIVEHFRNITERVLVIEWVDNEDAAVKYFGHINFNAGIHREEYNQKNFLEALNACFPAVIFGDFTVKNKTRSVYLAFCCIEDAIEWKRTHENICDYENVITNPTTHAHSIVTTNFTKVKKTVDVNHKFNSGHDTFFREIYWLTFLENKGNFPVLHRFNAENYTLETSYCGKSIMKIPLEERPTDFMERLRVQTKILDRWNCRHNDFKPHEWLYFAQNDKVYICDFGYASLGRDLTIGKKYGTADPPSCLWGRQMEENEKLMQKSLQRWPLMK